MLTIDTELLLSYRGLKSYIISAVNLTFKITNQALARIIGKNLSLRN